ncbi:MAG: dnaQ [Chitinophagaceae bacterium]|nr:dnaQ [Chitinophagaceae bacterium]
MYAIVDIETTGGYASGNNITEIAIFRFDGKKVVDCYHTLINPEQRIPVFITSLTGITTEMVEAAPTFAEVAQDILDFTEGCIFVAHNVNFDFTFLKQSFKSLDMSFERKKLCTVRLSRKIFPQLPSYSLGNLCGSLNIEITDRHRAKGDAGATVKLLQLLLEHDKEQFIEKSLHKNSRETLLPAHLPREQFDALPEEPGVYYFHDHKSKVIYVGKAINIKKRVVSHFSGKQNSKQSQRFMNEIYSISFERCGSELVALLLESHEIKKYWPAYNRSQKRVTKNYCIYQYTDQQGYARLSVGLIQKFQQSLLSFRTALEARDFLLASVHEHQLCGRLCGLHKTSVSCSDALIVDRCKVCAQGEDAARYNKKVARAVHAFSEQQVTLAIKEKGRSNEEYSIVLMESGKYLGYGFVPQEIQSTTFDELKTYIHPYQDNQDVRRIIESFTYTADDSSVIYF